MPPPPAPDHCRDRLAAGVAAVAHDQGHKEAQLAVCERLCKVS